MIYIAPRTPKMKISSKTLNKEMLPIVNRYKKDLRLSRRHPNDKILKIQVNYDKYIIKSLNLKEYLKKWQEN